MYNHNDIEKDLCRQNRIGKIIYIERTKRFIADCINNIDYLYWDKLELVEEK